MTVKDDRTDRIRAAVEAVKAGAPITDAASKAGVQWMEVRTACHLLGVKTRPRGHLVGSTQTRRRTHLVAGQRRVSVQLTHIGNPEMVHVDYSVPGVITLRAPAGAEETE